MGVGVGIYGCRGECSKVISKLTSLQVQTSLGMKIRNGICMDNLLLLD